ncbi:MAG: carboxylating nicotinate-nucleotide diphosphorylase [Legionella sp.]|nr:carboxylating nicotinate-nucleotide diphosphorylase [Legionella sp.]
MKVDALQIMSDIIPALQEDIGSGDVTANLLPIDLKARAEIISREPMLLCGKPWVDAIFNQMSSSIEVNWQVDEGDWLNKARVLCTIEGQARAILTAERTALNFLQTLSATATQTHRYVQQLKGRQTRLLDTRKTLPGLRYAQKYATLCGGAKNHRMGLYDAFLIKENHIKACGSIAEAIASARKTNRTLAVEIEVENLDQLEEAFAAHPDRVLLDNFTYEMLVKAVTMNQPKYCELEASGGITIDNLGDMAASGVDYISVGSITKSIQAIDLSLLIREIYES